MLRCLGAHPALTARQPNVVPADAPLLACFGTLNYQTAGPAPAEPAGPCLAIIGPAGARGFVDGVLWHAPESLHRVVLDKPATTFVDDDGNTQPFQDWQPIHFVFDWSAGGPQVALIQTHGQVP